MKRNERIDDPVIAFLEAIQGAQAGLWTAVPCKVESFNAGHQTVSAVPQIKALSTRQDGSRLWIDLPLLVDVPVIFPSGGGYSLTFPIKPGDECLVVFSSRNIDSWWDTGAPAPVNDLRMHDLSDGFAIFGPRSRPHALPSIASDGVVLRNDAGTSSVKIDDSGDVTINAVHVNVNASASASITAPTSITLTAATVAIVGNLSMTGGNATGTGTLSMTGDITGAGKHLATHTHSGVQTGTGNTGAPV